MTREFISLDEAGQTMAEYAVVLSVMIVGIASVFGLLSGAIAVAYEATVALINSIA